MSFDIYLKCKCCKLAVHDQSTTHNLTTMAEAVGLYEPLWHPERLNIVKAKELIKPLTLVEILENKFLKFIHIFSFIF